MKIKKEVIFHCFVTWNARY